MRKDYCDICEILMTRSDINSSVSNRVNCILDNLSTHSYKNLDICVVCACNLDTALKSLIESWKSNKGNVPNELA